MFYTSKRDCLRLVSVRYFTEVGVEEIIDFLFRPTHQIEGSVCLREDHIEEHDLHFALHGRCHFQPLVDVVFVVHIVPCVKDSDSIEESTFKDFPGVIKRGQSHHQ